MVAPVASSDAFDTLLGAQDDLITRAQAHEIALTDRQIQARVAKGEWHPVIRGVYLVGKRDLSRDELLRAALLYAGPNALFSHRTAAHLNELWGFTPPPKEAPSYAAWMKRHDTSPIELTVPIDERPAGHLTQPVSKRRIPLVVHQSSVALSEHMRTERHGFPCSTTARNVIELAESLEDRTISRADFAMAYEHAVTRGLWNMMELHCRELSRGRRHVQTVIEMMHRRGESGPDVESAAEAVCDDLFWNAKLRPARQHRLQPRKGKGIRVDFAFLEQNVTVDIEGFAFHQREQHASDRKRHNALVGLGFHPLYFPALNVLNRPREVLAEVVHALRQRGWKEPASEPTDRSPRQRRTRK